MQLFQAVMYHVFFYVILQHQRNETRKSARDSHLMFVKVFFYFFYSHFMIFFLTF